jgi:hypothetical protein
MQTTLRINDALYREAKAAAAREGITLTSFIETALQARLTRPGKSRPRLPVYDSGIRTETEVMALIAEAEADAAERAKTALLGQ